MAAAARRRAAGGGALTPRAARAGGREAARASRALGSRIPGRYNGSGSRARRSRAARRDATDDTVTLTIDGEAAEVRATTRIMATIAALLHDIDASLSADAREEPRWEIAETSRPDPARTVTTLRWAADAPDRGREAAAALVAGVRSLGERPARPPSFSDEALMRFRNMDQKAFYIMLSFESDRAIVTPSVVANANAVLASGDGDGNAGYEEYGSAEGPAETLDARAEPYFTVRDALTGVAVRCYFGEDEREAAARAVADRRTVSVEGMLHRDRAGRTRRIAPVRSIAAIDEPPAGDLDSLAGLFGDIGDTQAYLREIRGG